MKRIKNNKNNSKGMEEFNKIMKEQHKKIIQNIRLRYILKPLIREKIKVLGRKLTKEELKDIYIESLEKVIEGYERRHTTRLDSMKRLFEEENNER